MIIKTTDELLALRNEKGIIRVQEDLRIECDIPWSGVGELVNRPVKNREIKASDISFGDLL